MKKIIVFVSLALFLGSSIVFAQDTTKTKIITTKFKLPSVDVKTIDGATFNTSQLTNDGKPIIISFWALWCTNCIKELKAIQEVYDDWQEETGVKVVAVSIDDAKSIDKVKPFINGKSWDYQILLDPNKNLYRALNINQIPHTFVVNGNGEVVWQHITYTEGSEEDLYEIVKKVAEGKSIEE